MNEQQSKILTATSVLSVILLLVVSLQLSDLNRSLKGGSVAAAPTAPGAAPTAAPSAPNLDMAELVDDDPFLGDDDAPVTIIEWSDFECPFCGRFHSETYDLIKKNYIDTGKVKFVYRDFPLSFHPQAQKSAEAGECANEQGKFWEMHELLFESGVQGGPAAFKAYASQIGLDTAKFNSCLDSGKYAQEVQDDLQAGSAAGIRGTPGFIINGQLVSGAQPYAVFQQAIEASLK